MEEWKIGSMLLQLYILISMAMQIALLWYIATRKKIAHRTKITVNEFAAVVTRMEAGKQQTSIAQVKEILRITNDLLDCELYRLIRVNGIKWPEKKSACGCSKAPYKIDHGSETDPSSNDAIDPNSGMIK